MRAKRIKSDHLSISMKKIEEMKKEYSQRMYIKKMVNTK